MEIVIGIIIIGFQFLQYRVLYRITHNQNEIGKIISKINRKIK